jgi:iron complex transport system ATP-binding protein
VSPAALLDCENLTVFRGERLALDRITFSIPDGQHVAILGPNGSGKSTLVKTLTRECYPALVNGPARLRILGREVWSLFDLRALLGIVTQDLAASFSRPVTGRDAVLSGFFATIGLWPHQHVAPAMRERADAVLAHLNLAHLADRPLDEMSSGEARQIIIGRALVRDPQALILDEPTNSLDIRSTVDVRESIRRVAHAGTTLVLVTHQLADIVPEIERVILLRAGRIVADGAKVDVLTSASLGALYGVTLEVAERDGYYQWW